MVANEGKNRMVPVEGIEPPFLSERDFESRASTSSATRALQSMIFSEIQPPTRISPGRLSPTVLQPGYLYGRDRIGKSVPRGN